MSDTEETKLQITWKRTLIIWWSFVWRYIICALVLWLILIFITFFSLMAASKTKTELFKAIEIYGGILWYVSAAPISIIVLNKILKKRFTGFSICLIQNVSTNNKKGGLTMDKKPKVSLKASVVAVGILVIPFSLGYLLLFIKATQQVEIILGIIGFMYFYSIYVLASHLFTRGVIKMKAASVFWIAFFSSIIPIIHLIVPIYLLKKGNESLKLEGK